MPISLTHYIRVSEREVLPIELHCLEDSTCGKYTGGWLQEKHIKEILALLRDTIIGFIEKLPVKKAGSTSKQLAASTGIVTGSTVRLGYVFKKKPGHQYCLLPNHILSLGDYEDDDSLTSFHVLRHKLVVYTYLLASESPHKMSQLVKAMGDKRRTSGQGPSISSYFQKIPPSQTASHSSSVRSQTSTQNQSKQTGKQKLLHPELALDSIFDNQSSPAGNAADFVGSQSSVDEMETGSLMIVDNETGTITESALPGAPPSEGRRHAIKNIVERSNLGRKRRKVNMSKTTKFDIDLKKATEISKSNTHEQLSTKDDEKNQKIKSIDCNDVLSKVTISQVLTDKPCLKLTGLDSEVESSVTLISADQMHEIKERRRTSSKMEENSSGSSTCKESPQVTETKSSSSCDQVESISDVSCDSVLPSASFCTKLTESVSSCSGSTVEIKNVLSSPDQNINIQDDVTDSPKFSRKKKEIHGKELEKSNAQNNEESQKSASSYKESGNDYDSSNSSEAEINCKVKKFRFKRKFPTFSDSDSENNFPETKIARKIDSKSKMSKTNQSKPRAKKFEISKSFFTDDGSKTQSTLSAFMYKGNNKEKLKHNTDNGSALKEKRSASAQECVEVEDVVDIDNELIKELSDHNIVPIVKNERDVILKDEIRSINSVHVLNDEHIHFLIKNNEKYLRGIFEGRYPCVRHEAYKSGGKARRDLIHCSRLGHYSEEQIDTVMEALIAIFCKRHHKYLDYIMKVMLPEVLIKLHMDVHDTTHDESEMELAQKPSI